jgi:paraquat-inducible protein A
VDIPLALALTALVLLIPANGFWLMRVSSFGASRVNWLSTGATAFWQQGYSILAIVVGMFAVILPFAFLAALSWVLLRVRADRTAGVGRVFRWVKYLRPWTMLDVFLLGCFVAYSRLGAVATVEVGIGGWCLVAAAFVSLIALTQLDERTVWAALPHGDPLDGGERTIACTSCELIVADAAHASPCPRCGARLHVRKPQALPRTLALVIAGYVLYVPANILPVMTLVKFGDADTTTIMGGVLELISNDLWPLAVIVFLASIVVPLVKLTSLTWMLIATRLRSRAFIVGRTRLYRFIDAIGRWSNIDVFMGSVLLALLRFGSLTNIKPGAGLVAFAAVVMISMTATVVFDARLMWDAALRRPA